MIWVTVSSQSCFWWVYRASPSLAAKNIINLTSVLSIWWCRCVGSSCVLLKEGVCYDHCVLLKKTLLAFVLFHFVLQDKSACYSMYLLTSFSYRLVCECPVVSSRGTLWWWPVAGSGALCVAIPAGDLLKDVTIIFITSTILWSKTKRSQNKQTKKGLKQKVGSTAPPIN